jgi:hypothetical protein
LIVAKDFDSDNTRDIPAIVNVSSANGLVCPRAVDHGGKQDATTGSFLYQVEF